MTMMLFLSSGSFPCATSSDWPNLDDKEQNRNSLDVSISSSRFTPPLHKLQSPSNMITGRKSSLQISWTTLLQSHGSNSSICARLLLAFVRDGGAWLLLLLPLTVVLVPLPPLIPEIVGVVVDASSKNADGTFDFEALGGTEENADTSGVSDQWRRTQRKSTGKVPRIFVPGNERSAALENPTFFVMLTNRLIWTLSPLQLVGEAQKHCKNVWFRNQKLSDGMKIRSPRYWNSAVCCSRLPVFQIRYRTIQ